MADELRPSECCQYCPYLEPVQGSCDHQLHQTLLQQFARDPEATCAVYQEVRADRMATLVEQMDPGT